MQNVVADLYRGSWPACVSRAAASIPRDQAGPLVRELTAHPGWRERVAAARVAAAFQLYAAAPPLVRTFAHNPEHYTADAFARLASLLPAEDREALLAELRKACPPNAYGSRLLEVIAHASKPPGEA